MAQPMINVLNYNFDAENAFEYSDGTKGGFINLPKSLTETNRVLYRAARRYAVAGVQVIGNDGATFAILTAPDNYVTKNACKKAFHMWDKMQKAATDESGMSASKARFRDFKVFLNPAHRSNVATEMRPVNDFNSGISPSQGEWEMSELIYPSDDPDAQPQTDAFMHICGPHVNNNGSTQGPTAEFDPYNVLSVGLIQAYRQSRRVVPEPSPGVGGVVTKNPYGELFDYGDVNEDILDDALFDNDRTPYSDTDYVGDANWGTAGLQNSGELRIQTAQTVNVTGGFIAPFGLIGIRTNQDSGIMRIKVMLVPADNKYGVLSEAIV